MSRSRTAARWWPAGSASSSSFVAVDSWKWPAIPAAGECGNYSLRQALKVRLPHLTGSVLAREALAAPSRECSEVGEVGSGGSRVVPVRVLEQRNAAKVLAPLSWIGAVVVERHSKYRELEVRHREEPALRVENIFIRNRIGEPSTNESQPKRCFGVGVGPRTRQWQQLEKAGSPASCGSAGQSSGDGRNRCAHLRSSSSPQNVVYCSQQLFVVE